MDQTSEILERLGNKFFVLSGDDSLTLPLMAIGAIGVISVAANMIPRTISDMVTAFLMGDINRARALHLKIYPLVKSLFIETNPGPIKAAMREAKLLKDETLRLPLVTVSQATRQKIKLAMKNFGL